MRALTHFLFKVRPIFCCLYFYSNELPLHKRSIPAKRCRKTEAAITATNVNKEYNFKCCRRQASQFNNIIIPCTPPLSVSICFPANINNLIGSRLTEGKKIHRAAN